jgi:hypothetical protein
MHLPGGRKAQVPGRDTKGLDRRHFGQARTVAKPVEVAVRQFPDGTKLRLICDPDDPTRTMFAVWRDGGVQLQEEFEYGRVVFRPPRRDDPLVHSLVLPRGVQPPDAPSTMALNIGALLNEVVPLAEAHQLVLGTFVVRTWTSDGSAFAPTVAFCGPRDFTVPLLQALGLVCRYGMVVGDATPAGLLEACSRSSPTLLIVDYGLRRDTIRLLEIGSRSGIYSLQKGGVFPSWCPRAIACSDPSLGRDLLSGGMMISLSGSEWPHLELFTNSRFLERAANLQMQLLGYDLERGGTIRPLAAELPTGMKPREWEAFRWWAGPFTGDQSFLVQLLDAIRWSAELAPDGLPVGQVATIAALDHLAHKGNESVSVGEICALTNKVLVQMGADLRLKERKIGAILTKLGFPRRERGGSDGPYQLELSSYTKDYIHKLVKSFGRWPVEVYDTHGPDVTCDFCRKYRLLSDAEIKHYDEVLKPREELRKREEEERRKRRMESLRKKPPPISQETGNGPAAKP